LLLLVLLWLVSDATLVRRYQRGQARALETLYERYRAPLLTFLTRMIGDAGDAEDAFVETWIRIARALPGYEEQGKFRSFAFTVARREALHLLERRANRDSRAALGHEGNELDRIGDTGATGPEEGAARAEIADRIDAALDVLSEELRSCFLLYHAEGFTVPQVAEATGLSPATVKRRIGKARGILAARLADVRSG